MFPPIALVAAGSAARSTVLLEGVAPCPISARSGRTRRQVRLG